MILFTVAWTILSLAGFWLASRGARSVRGDIAYNRANRINGLRSRITRRNLRKEQARLVVFSINLALGLFVLFVPERTGLLRLLVPTGLVLSNAFLVIDAAFDRLTRYDLREYWRKTRGIGG